jgi:hypothetical protein
MSRTYTIFRIYASFTARSDPADARNEEHRSEGILQVCRVSEHHSDEADDESELELECAEVLENGIRTAMTKQLAA